MRKQRVFAFVVIFVSATVAIVDGIIKSAALHSLSSEAGSILRSPIAFAVHKNLGIAFDIGVPMPVIIFSTILVIVALLVLAFRKRVHAPMSSAFALTAVFGATGNLVDRMVNGFTTDYLIFFRLSAVNLSDALIVVGLVGILVYTQTIPNRREEK